MNKYCITLPVCPCRSSLTTLLRKSSFESLKTAADSVQLEGISCCVEWSHAVAKDLAVAVDPLSHRRDGVKTRDSTQQCLLKLSRIAAHLVGENLI